MNVHEMFVADFNEIVSYALKQIAEVEADFKKEFDWLDSIENDIQQFKKTGVLSIQSMGTSSETEQVEKGKPTSKTNGRENNSSPSSSSTNSIKENIQSNHQTSGRRITRKMAVLEQHDNLNINPDATFKVKLEKINESFIDNVQTNSKVKVKEEMPPPNKRPVRNTRKKKGNDMPIKMKSELIDEQIEMINSDRDSDVEIQKQVFDVVVLEDTIIEQDAIRATRSRTKMRKVKDQKNDAENKSDDERQIKKSRRTRSRNNTEENEIKDSEEPLSKKRKIDEELNHSEYLDAPSTSTPISLNQRASRLDATQLINRPVLHNATVVLEKPTVQKEPVTLKDIMTDDEDIVDSSPSESTRHKKNKPVFSPYENSPVKKRVQAFEKLGATTQIPTKTTRSKFVQQPSVDDHTKKNSTHNLREIPRFVGTPLNKIKHLQTSSASKLPTNAPNSSYSVLNKAATGIKTSASQMEFQEREFRRKLKETEALQKKEAMILAQTEEKRKRREEREMKVQKHKMEMEKDKKKQLETTEKTKEEKLKQVMAEKEAKLLKLKEEAAKKRAAVAKKAFEIKRNDEKFIPPYLKYETPLLPTPDCYDSDESSSNHRIKIPSFQKERQFSQMQKDMRSVEGHKKIFFLSGPRTPNLQAIFPTIEPSKLKRTSSAIWNKTEMSLLNNLTDEDLGEED